MSKKRASTTMTLKDFHGGSIPSDLALPSAPGVSGRQPDRAGCDRPMGGGWGIGGRMDPHRLSRPGSAGGGSGSRGFVDEVAPPFLPNTARIGRNFDEDERKPFDASSAPRRAAAVEVDDARLQRSGTDAKQSQPQQQQLFGRPGSSPAAVPQHLTGGLGFPVAGAGPPAQQLSGSASGGPATLNAWGVRKEVASESQSQVQPTSTWSGPAAASRFAQASAIEKISSGRWQSKPLSFGQTADIEVIGSPEIHRGNAGSKDNGAMYGGVSSNQGYDERVDAFDGRCKDERLVYEQARYLVIPQVKERSSTIGVGYDETCPDPSEGRYDSLPVHQQYERLGRSQANQQEGRFNTQQVQQLEGRLGGLQLTQQDHCFDGSQMRCQGEEFGRLQTPQHEGKFNASQVYQQGTAEISERPKLKLLPRTKPLKSSEVYALDSKQGNQPLPAEDYNETYINLQPMKPGSAGTDGGNRNLAVERPRLSLKPRAQPIEKSYETIERERKTLFGGARPRELVLKERGIDTAPNDIDQSMPESRIKHELSKVDVKSDSVSSSPKLPARNADGYPSEHRPARDTERKDFLADPERLDVQRNSRKDNWRNNREIEKPRTEHCPEPDSWRKPAEEPKPDIPGQRFGKAASALELTQAFSRSVSDRGSDSHLTSQRGVPGRSQVPFSRLTDNREIYSGPTPRKINGY